MHMAYVFDGQAINCEKVDVMNTDFFKSKCWAKNMTFFENVHSETSKLKREISNDGAQWETLCSEGRRKPLNDVLYKNILYRLKDILFAVKYAKFCRNMFTGSMSTSKSINVSYFANAR